MVVAALVYTGCAIATGILAVIAVACGRRPLALLADLLALNLAGCGVVIAAILGDPFVLCGAVALAGLGLVCLQVPETSDE